jgi:hypothetical protein
MLARKYKIELEAAIIELEKHILSHWKGHKKPLWTHTWEEQLDAGFHEQGRVQYRYELELIVAIIWITQGAKGCTCYASSPVLQDRVANYFMLKGAIEACSTMIKEILGTCNPEENLPLTKPRKLLI